MSDAVPTPPFDSAELTAMAHLYRGERYHSTVWRTRLDTTTNWAVVTTGAILSAAAASPHLPAWSLLVLAGVLTMFLSMEARRYRYHDIWRTRVRVMERCLFVPLLRGKKAPADWREILANDYDKLRFHISAWEALGRRLRRNYAGLFLLQAVGYLGKLTTSIPSEQTPSDWLQRAAIGIIPGAIVLACVALFYLALITVALVTRRDEHPIDRMDPHELPEHDAMLALAGAQAHASSAHS